MRKSRAVRGRRRSRGKRSAAHSAPARLGRGDEERGVDGFEADAVELLHPPGDVDHPVGRVGRPRPQQRVHGGQVLDRVARRDQPPSRPEPLPRAGDEHRHVTAAAAASVATTTSRAAMIVPSASVTRPGSTAAALVPVRTVASGSAAASCRGIASMPPRGRQARPSANIAKSKRNTVEAVSRDRSRNTPPKKGSKKRRTKPGEKPRAARASRGSPVRGSSPAPAGAWW